MSWSGDSMLRVCGAPLLVRVMVQCASCACTVVVGRAHTLTLTCAFFAACATGFTPVLAWFGFRVRGVMMPASTLRFFVRRLTNHVLACFASMPMVSASCVTR